MRYGQLHEVELDAAARVARAFGVEHRIADVDLVIRALGADIADVAVPKDRSLADIGAPGDVPATYVPARNTVLLSLALAWAETLGARDLFVGVNVLDASGYPDCRPEFVRAFEALAQVATRVRRLPRARAADRADEGRDHPARRVARRRLRDHALLLRSATAIARAGGAMRACAATEGFRRGRRAPIRRDTRYDHRGVKLGTLLLRNAAIGLSQLEAALRNQVLYGGRLGTNLVELGFLDLELLSAYLAELSRPAGRDAERCSTTADAATLLDRLGGDEAHRLRAIPLGRRHDGAVAVAMVDPTDKDARRASSAPSSARRSTPHVVPELRALYYLEKHFGLPRRARFVRTQRPGSDRRRDRRRADERRRAQPAAAW